MSKDIYELLNDIEYDATLDEEIPMDDIKKKKLKKNIKKKIKVRKNSNLLKTALVACLALALLVTATVTTDVIAKIKESVFFNPGLGLVVTSEEVYVLDNPISAEINGKDILIKSVISKENELNIGIWIDNELFNSKEQQEKFKIKLSDGEILDININSVGSGGSFTSLTQNYKTNELVKEFTLLFDGNTVSEVSLIEEGSLDTYDEVGGNSTVDGLMIGGNKYIFGGNTYISLWNNKENNLEQNVFYNKEDINVFDKNGEKYDIDYSNYSGLGNEFMIKGEVNEPLNIKINKVEVDYVLKNKPKIKVNIPKNNETININEEIYFEDLDEKILMKNISRIDNTIELTFDVNKLKKEGSEIIILNLEGINHGVIGSADGSDIVVSFDYEDLKFMEKINNKLEVIINKADLYKKGCWNFTID